MYIWTMYTFETMYVVIWNDLLPYKKMKVIHKSDDRDLLRM